MSWAIATIPSLDQLSTAPEELHGESARPYRSAELEAPGITRGGLLVPAAPALPGGLREGRIKSAVHVGAQRGVGGEVSLTAVPEDDVVVLEIADGPALVLHPETARDDARRLERRSAAARPARAA